MRFSPAFFGLVVSIGGALSGGCGSSSSEDSGIAAADPGAGTETNPYGAPYPTAGLGFHARSEPRATIAGDKIRNFKFLGYVDSDRSKGLTTISLADFFDPEMRKYKIVHISVAGVWCTWCQAETDALEAVQSDGKTRVAALADEKVVYLTALSEDVQHNPATLSDLDYWVQTRRTTYTQVLDPGNRNLGPFFTSAGIPWNGNIDARSMEILSSVTAAPTSDGQTIDILGDVQPWLDWVDAHPATP
jgi:hypothetical protein